MVWEIMYTVQTSNVNFNLTDNQYNYRLYNPRSFNILFVMQGGGNSVSNTLTPQTSYNIPDYLRGVSLTITGTDLELQRELKNTAPTQPGPFTQPTGELEIGDTRTISWGASTDAEGNIAKYIVEHSINGGSWAYFIDGLITSIPHTISTAPGTLKFRVKAVDSAGLESPYRESPTYTVTKPKYYWSKYNVVKNPGYGELSSSLSTMQLANLQGWYPTFDIYEDWAFNSTTQKLNGVSRKVTGVEPYELFSIPTLYTNNFAIRSDFYNSADVIHKLQNNVIGSLATGNAARNAYPVNLRASTETRGTLIQSGLIAEEGTYPLDGKHTDGFWYLRGTRVNQSIAPNKEFTAPSPGTILKPSRNISVSFLGSTAANVVLYEVEYRYNSGLWTTLGPNTVDFSRSFTVTTDKTLTSVQFRVRAKNNNNIYSDYIYTDVFSIEHNAKPTITLTTADNPSLTENANLVIAGQAVDTDNGNVLTVYYQINTGTTTAIATGISNGTTPLTYSKTLQFRQGTLYDGTTSVFANLVGNQTYTLKVWAEDNQGGKSDVQTRSFTVVPNRAPIVTVAALATTTDKINNDSITVNGTVTDPDNQTVVVKYRINSGTLVQAYSGAGGNYTFNFKLASLNDGDNIVEIQASDVYGLTTTIRRKFTKTKNKKELLESVVRYRGILPAAGITGVVTWFEREKGDLTLTPSLSLTTTGQNESFTNMNLSNTGPVTDTITEDQYQLATDNPKTGMTLKVNLKRTATTSDKGIKKITGALQ